MKTCTWCGATDAQHETDNLGERLCDTCEDQYVEILESQGLEAP